MNEANNFQIAENPPLVIPDGSNCPFSIVFNEDCVQGLKRVADGVKSMIKIMNDKTLSKDFTIDDCVKYLKEKFGIDVHELE